MFDITALGQNNGSKTNNINANKEAPKTSKENNFYDKVEKEPVNFNLSLAKIKMGFKVYLYESFQSAKAVAFPFLSLASKITPYQLEKTF